MVDVQEREPIVVRPSEAETVSSGPLQVRYLVEEKDGVGWSMIHYTVPPGFGPPPILHRHTREYAALYLLEGRIEVTFMHGTEQLGPGSLVVLPPGCWFRWRNASEEQPLSWLGIFCPAGFEQFFREVAEAFEAHGGAGPEAINEILGPLRAKYGDENHPDAQ